MNAYVVIAIIVLSPLVVLTLLRVNSATAFLALSLGGLLSTYVAADLLDVLRGYTPPDSQITEMIVGLLLLWLPVVLVSFFMARTISPRQRFLNAVPALAVGLVGLLLTVPLLTPQVQLSVYATNIWQICKDYQAIIVLVSTIISIVLLRMRAPLGEPHHGKHHAH